MEKDTVKATIEKLQAQLQKKYPGFVVRVTLEPKPLPKSSKKHSKPPQS